MQENLTPLIADYGFHNLKDISSVFIRYKNKNSYTSPELLKNSKSISNKMESNTKNNLIYKPDVYSFGMLLWELYTCTIPFNVKIHTLIDLVVRDNYRPEIKPEMNRDISNLIRQCWDSDPNKRPDFKNIINILNKIKIII
jgi:serine/threonine protein kinase